MQEEFCGFTDDDIRRVSKRTSAVQVLHENLLKRSQPPANVEVVNRRRTVDARTISSHTPSDKNTLSPLSPSDSDSSPTRGSLKGNIKVRLLLGSYKLVPSPKERHGKTALGGVIRNTPTAVTGTKERRKRRRSSSGQSDDSVVSSSGESDVKYSLLNNTAPRRGRPPLQHAKVGRKTNVAPLVRKRGRPPLQPVALVHARARQLVSKARGDLQADKKPRSDTAVRSRAPFWCGRLQLPTQSSRSSRKIIVNRRFLDDSYTSILQPGLSQQRETKNTSVPPAAEDHWSRKRDKFVAGSRVRGVGLLNRPLVTKPAMKHVTHLQACDKTALQRPQQAKSSSGTTENTSDAAVVANAAADNDTYRVNDMNAPWIKNAHKSVFSNQIKKGSMVGQHCYICDSMSIVHHYFMCRVPCCRGCSKFYKRHCERNTRLEQLTCLQQGK